MGLKNSNSEEKYAYLKRLEFYGVSGQPTRMGSSAEHWWAYHWVGTHTQVPYLEHTISVSPEFDGLFSDTTHLVTVHVQRVARAAPKLLYIAQFDLSCMAEVNQVAEQLTIALVLFFLRQGNPAKCPGICDLPHSTQQSRWAIVLKETIDGISRARLDAIALSL